MMSNKDSISQLLTRGVEKIYPSKKFLEEKLRRGEKIKIYNGIDPSTPEVHIGHAVIYRKMREFQKLGHKVILLIGDFTGQIGDPSDKLAARKRLTSKKVSQNAEKYKEQIGKILDFDDPKNPAEIKFNSQWLNKLSFAEGIELAYNFTVQQMLERDMFQERLKKGKEIYLPEFLYPVMQGYDSVAMQVDAEIGGTDQTFNMLAGRKLMKAVLGKEKIVITCPLLLGLDGEKMSKSLGNTIGVTEAPNEMYGKVMSLKDEFISQYFELATDVAVEQIAEFKRRLKAGENPMNLKKILAKEIVKIYQGEKAAVEAEREFEKVVQAGELPSEIPAKQITKGQWQLADLLVECKLGPSKSEAKRLIEQGAVEVDGKKITTYHPPAGGPITISDGMIIRAGKRKFVLLKVI